VGDYSTAMCWNAKYARMAPVKIAEIVVKALPRRTSLQVKCASGLYQLHARRHVACDQVDAILKAARLRKPCA